MIRLSDDTSWNNLSMTPRTSITPAIPGDVTPIEEYSMFYSQPLVDGARIAILYAPCIQDEIPGIVYTISRCNPNDEFRRSTARQKCLQKLNSNRWATFITQDEINTFLACFSERIATDEWMSEYIPSPLFYRLTEDSNGDQRSCGEPYDLCLLTSELESLEKALNYTCDYAFELSQEEAIA